VQSQWQNILHSRLQSVQLWLSNAREVNTLNHLHSSYQNKPRLPRLLLYALLTNHPCWTKKPLTSTWTTKMTQTMRAIWSKRSLLTCLILLLRSKKRSREGGRGRILNWLPNVNIQIRNIILTICVSTATIDLAERRRRHAILKETSMPEVAVRHATCLDTEEKRNNKK